MYQVTIKNPFGYIVQTSNLPALQLAQFVMHNDIGGMEYDGQVVVLRMAATSEPVVDYDRKVAWVENYLDVDIVGCC